MDEKGSGGPPPVPTGRALIVGGTCSVAATAAFFARPHAGAFAEAVVVAGIFCTVLAVVSFCTWLAAAAARSKSPFLRALETFRSYLADER